MVIKASSRPQIDHLIASLESSDRDVREAAVTRLTVIGTRALERLMALAADGRASTIARTGALRALEGIADPRSLDVVLDGIDSDDPDVSSAAAGAARVFLRGARGAVAVDRLTSAALDTARADQARSAAVLALADLEPSTLAPLYTALAGDASPALAALARSRRDARTPVPPSRPASLEDIIDGEWPDDPAALRTLVMNAGPDVSLALLHRLIERLREREQADGAGRRMDWMRVRGAAHTAMAERGSRVALYDLRETLEASTESLPVEFLAALRQIGDASCLEAIAAAYTRAMGSRDREDWWHRHLTDAFRTIVSRERITRRHAAMKRIEKRWPAILEER